jgi:hypothetical protein
MRFVREHDQAGGTAIAANCLEELVSLQWRSARIGILRTVHDEERGFQFVGEKKWGHFQIDIRRLPNRAPLVLETEGRERFVNGATGARRKNGVATREIDG